jgi:hypothetical protein
LIKQSEFGMKNLKIHPPSNFYAEAESNPR